MSILINGTVYDRRKHRVLIDGEETVLTYDSYSGSRGHQYLTPCNGGSHAFPFLLRKGQRFRTNGHVYEILTGGDE
jgi:hypothetical protein